MFVSPTAIILLRASAGHVVRARSAGVGYTRPVPLAVLAVVFVVYAWTAAPGMMWLDAAELTTAAATLGIAHPPGHPIPSLLGKLLALVPLGDVAWRVNLASALAGAIAAAATAHAAARVARRVAPDATPRLALAA